METFFSILSKRIDVCSSLLCVGLDPHPSDLPTATAEAARDFCVNLIKKTAMYAAAFKPNAAFFEFYGPEGWKALEDVVATARLESDRLGSHIPVILDAKRGDIASTAEAYASSAFEKLGTDAITLNPFLGQDSIEPFLSFPGKGVFLLCKTSNPGASDLQDLPIVSGKHNSMLIYEHIAHLSQKWNTRDNIGLVVGATQPEALSRVRKVAAEAWILSPGVGAQGGDLDTTLRYGLRRDGKGLLIPVSRSLSRAGNVTQVAAEMRDNIIGIRNRMNHE